MASNPMQRKVRNAFLGGFLIALIIAAIVVVFLYMELNKVKTEQKEEQEILTSTVYVIKNMVQSGGVLKGNIEYKTITSDTVPVNAVTTADLQQYITEEGATSLTIGDYLSEDMVTKINLQPGTILTSDMIAYKDTGLLIEENGAIKMKSGVKLEEYNMIALPTKLEAGDYIDIRLQLPTGGTFIVASKKYVEDTDATTVWLQMDEEEILAMNNAIVEAYTMKGAKLYANIYVDGGFQAKANATYVPSNEVKDLITKSPNIVQEARDALTYKYNETSGYRDLINNSLNLYEEDRIKNTEEGITTEIENLRESRQEYLDELNAY